MHLSSGLFLQFDLLHRDVCENLDRRWLAAFSAVVTGLCDWMYARVWLWAHGRGNREHWSWWWLCVCPLCIRVFKACLRKDSYFWSNIRLQTVTEQCEDFLCVFHTFQAVNTLLQHKEPSGLLTFAETLSLWPSGSSFVFWISLV